MDFIFHPLTKEEARVIAGWRYDPPYAFYNAENDPDDLAELLQCEELDDVYYAVVDGADTLVGFFCFYRHADRVDIGLGVRPDLTGRGLGRNFVMAGLTFAQQRFAPPCFRLAVAIFNERAIRVYSAAGFQKGQIFLQRTNGGEFEFVEMTRSAKLD